MKRTISYLLSICVVAFVACKKTPIPVEVTSTPEFYLNCDYDGVPLNLSAGNDNYYMSASYFQDSTTNVYVYKSVLTQTNCTNCGYALSVLVNDTKTTTPNGSMNIDRAIKVGNYIFNDDNLEPMFYRASFTPEKNNPSDGTFMWQFADTTINDLYKVQNKLFEANKEFTENLNYVSAAGDCGTNHTNIFKAGNPIQTTIKAVKDLAQPPFTYNFSSLTTTKWPIVSYFWDFGDSFTSTNSSPTHVYKSFGKNNVMLRLIDSKNDTCTSYYQLDVADGSSTCDANYTASFIPVPNTVAYSAITILFTDANGKVYSSKGFSQPETSKFEIEEINTYQPKPNERMEPTKKLKIKFNCSVKNGNEIKKITNGEAVIAVSYK